MKKVFLSERLRVLETIRYFRKDSLFFRFYLLTFIIAFALILISSFYISELINENNRARNERLNQQILERTVNQIDNSLSFLDQILQVAGNNKYIIDAIIRPNPIYADRNQDVVSFLKEIQENNPYITQIWLYEDTVGTVFSSSGTVKHYESENASFQLLQMLDQMEQNADTHILHGDSRARALLTLYEGELYLCYQFITATDSGFLGTIVAKINDNYLFSSTVDQVDNLNYAITVYSGEDLLYSNADPDGLSALSKGEIIEFTSLFSQWQYCLYPKEYSGTSVGQILRQMAPFLLVMTICGLGIALVIAEKSYYPIYTLTRQLQKNSGSEFLQEGDGDHTEIGFLYRTYSSLLQDKKRAEFLIQDARPELEKRLFSQLINGVEYTQEQLRQQLDNIHSGFSVSGSWRVFILYFDPNDRRETLTSYLTLRDVEHGILERFPKKLGEMQYLQKNDYGILILQYAPNTAPDQCAVWAEEFEKQLERMLRLQGVAYVSAWSGVFSSLCDLDRVCQETNETIRRQIYMNSDNTDPEPAAGNGIQQEDVQELLRQLKELLNQNEIAEAEQCLEKAFQIIHSQSDQTVEAYQLFLDTLIERSIQLNAEKQFATKDYQEIYGALQSADDWEMLSIEAKKAADRIFEFIKSQSLCRKNRFVEKAKEYVRDHYSNGDLSLQMIADNVGISASYLSNLFATQTGEALVTYINQYRINVAISLLQSTTISIKEVGFKTGFNTAQNFNRVFKRITGKNPGMYRANPQEPGLSNHEGDSPHDPHS